MTTKLKNTLLAFSEALRKGQTILCSKKDKDLADKIEEMVKALSTKHDPCRIFKEGDIVSPKSWYDRKPWGYSNSSIVRLNTCWKCTVIADEHRGIVKCKTNSGYLFETAPCFLELVTPVDELEPYIVGESTDYFSVDDREGEELSIYWKNKHPHAKESAEAECNRLNDEHRKEQ